MYTLIGKVSFINDKEQLKENFAKIVVGVLQVGNYQPLTMPFEFVNDKMRMVDTIKVNDEVRVHFMLSASQWTNQKGKINHSVSLRPYKVDNLTTPIPAPTPAVVSKEFTDKTEEQIAPSGTPKEQINELFNNL